MIENKNYKLFNCQKMNKGSNILIVASRRSGKTTLANNILKSMFQEQDSGIIVGPCEIYLKEYSNYFKNCKSYYKFTDKDYNQISNYKFIIIDYSKELNKDLLKKLMLSTEIFVIVIDQYPYKYREDINFDYVFSFKNTSGTNYYLQRLYDNYYSSPSMTMNNFLSTIDKCKSYTCFVVEKDNLSNCNYYFYNAKSENLTLDNIINEDSTEENKESHNNSTYCVLI